MASAHLRAAWAASFLAMGVLGALGALLAVAPDLWSSLFTKDEAVLEAAATYFLWAGPAYGLFGLGLSLYFSSLGAGKVIGPVLAGTLRLLLVALGGWVHNRALLILPETQLAKGRAGS